MATERRHPGWPASCRSSRSRREIERTHCIAVVQVRWPKVSNGSHSVVLCKGLNDPREYRERSRAGVEGSLCLRVVGHLPRAAATGHDGRGQVSHKPTGTKPRRVRRSVVEGYDAAMAIEAYATTVISRAAVGWRPCDRANGAASSPVVSLSCCVRCGSDSLDHRQDVRQRTGRGDEWLAIHGSS
jgi:hypothetical protein